MYREKYNLKIYNQIIGNNILKKILSEKYLDISKKTFFLDIWCYHRYLKLIFNNIEIESIEIKFILL